MPSPDSSASSSSNPAAPLSPTRPRLLPWALMLALALFFIALTAMAVGSSGLAAFCAWVSGHPLGAPTIVAPPAAQPKPARASALRSSSSLLSWLPLVPLPPVNAVPSGVFVFDEYLSLYWWLFRSFIVRPLWHAVVWWHVICAIAVAVELFWWRWKYAGEHSVALLSFLAHVLFWALQAAVFGWPTIYLLRQQLYEKRKET